MKLYQIALVSFGVCALTTIARAQDLPKRQPGLWEMTVTQGEGIPGQTMKQCIDAATDAKMMQMGQEMSGAKDACSKMEFTRTATGFASATECNFGGSKISSKGTFTGDFTSSYSGEVLTTFDPPFMGKGSQRVGISGKWLGACPAAMKPGEMVMNNGMKMNVEDMSRQAKHAAEIMKSGGAKAATQMLGNPDVQRAMRQAEGQFDPAQRDAMKKALEQMADMQHPE